MNKTAHILQVLREAPDISDHIELQGLHDVNNKHGDTSGGYYVVTSIHTIVNRWYVRPLNQARCDNCEYAVLHLADL